MFEVLTYLYETWFDCESCPDPDTLRIKLRAAGFDVEEIDDALSWLGGLADGESARLPDAFAERASFHAYAPAEARTLSIECRGYLAFLEERGIIDPIEREVIIARAQELPQGAPDIGELRIVALIVLWAEGTELDSLALEELLPDDGTAARH
jgi:Smg protein